jgi:hypothetical protein
MIAADILLPREWPVPPPLAVLVAMKHSACLAATQEEGSGTSRDRSAADPDEHVLHTSFSSAT